MAIRLAIPLAWANNIPGVSGVEDVSVSLPDVDDIRDAILENTVDLEEIETAVDRVLFDFFQSSGNLTDLLDLIGDRLREEVLDAGAETVDLADEIASRTARLVGAGETGNFEIDLQGQLFALEEDFEQVIERAFDTADFEGVGQFPTLDEIRDIISEELPEAPAGEIPTAESIADELEGRLPDFPEESFPSLQDIADEAESATERAIRALPNGDLLTDLDTVVDSQIDRVTDGLVSEEAQDSLEQALEDFE